MKQTVLIQHGQAHEIWRGGKTRLTKLFHADLVAQMVETDQPVEVGDLWDGTAFSPPPAEDPRPAVIAERNRLLAASDWTQLPDAPVNREAWSIYRKQLRDLTDQPDFPATVRWPDRP